MHKKFVKNCREKTNIFVQITIQECNSAHSKLYTHVLIFLRKMTRFEEP